YGMYLEDRPGADPTDGSDVLRYAVTPAYLETMAIPVLSGRAVTDADRAGSPPVALVNETVAKRLFPGGNAVGRRARVGGSRPPVTIVGIVGNTLHRGMDDRPDLQVYIPSSQWGEEGGMTLVVHTSVRSETA